MPFRNPPLFERRGLMLDISRNRVPTMETLRQLVDALHALQYNELQLYTEHTFAYTGHETVWQNASPMTAEEIHELDDYCGLRGIELVPNQNSFGHMERWLRHDTYRPLAECPDGFEHPLAGWRDSGSTLYPSKESAAFMDELYAELLPNFTSSQLHIGGDEPWELGKGRSAARVASQGKHRIYLDFMKRLFTLTRAHGRRPQFWADIIMERPDLVPELPEGVIPVIWGYEADSPFAEQCRVVAEAGFANRYYVAPGAGNWNSFSGRLDVAEANIRLAAECGHAHGARGLLLTAWGDNGHHQPWLSLYPALVLAAAAAHGQQLNRADLSDWIDQYFFPQRPAGHGAAICALGAVDSLLPQPAPPNSFLHSAFFASQPDVEKKLRSLVSRGPTDPRWRGSGRYRDRRFGSRNRTRPAPQPSRAGTSPRSKTVGKPRIVDPRLRRPVATSQPRRRAGRKFRANGSPALKETTPFELLFTNKASCQLSI